MQRTLRSTPDTGITGQPTEATITAALNFKRAGYDKFNWQMTLEEYLASNGNPANPVQRDYLIKYHAALVKFARERGLLPPIMATVDNHTMYMLHQQVVDVMQHYGYDGGTDFTQGTCTLPKDLLDAMLALSAQHPCDHGIHEECLANIRQANPTTYTGEPA